MPRTYLKSAEMKPDPVKVTKLTDQWRTRNVFDSSDEDLGMISVRKKDDLFDQLFNNINTNKIRAPLQDTNLGEASSDYDSSHTSSTSQPRFGLFHSFQEEDCRDPRRDSSSICTAKRSRPIKKQKKKTDKNKENFDSATGGTLLCELNFASASPASSLLKFDSYTPDSAIRPDVFSPVIRSVEVDRHTKQSVESPLPFFQTPGGKTGCKTFSCVTSTPLLDTKTESSPEKDISIKKNSRSSIGSHCASDDVFSVSVQEDPHPNLAMPEVHGAAARLDSNDILGQTPDKLVNKFRGKKTYGGPALSLMKGLNWKLTMHTCLQPPYLPDGGSTSTVVGSEAESVNQGNLSSSELSETPPPVGLSQSWTCDAPAEGSISVYISCVCGNDEEFPGISLIICDGCSYAFHPSCVGLDEQDINLIVEENPDWFCPKCEAELGTRPEQRVVSVPAIHSDLSNHSELHDPAGQGNIEEESFSDVETNVPLAVEVSKSMSPLHSDETTRNEVTAKPGKKWRRSISVQLTKDYEATDSGTNPRLSKEFAVPMFPAAVTRPARRQSSRISKRVSKLPKLPGGLIDIAEESSMEDDTFVDPGAGSLKLDTCENSRASFCIVPRNKEIDNTVADASILINPEISDIERLLKRCTIPKVVIFQEIYDVDSLRDSLKVGEGAFGEVYLVGESDGARPVLKVVPIGGELKVNDEDQTSFADMMSEVVISTSLSNLRFEEQNNTDGFVEVRKCAMFEGLYPSLLLDLWDQFDREKTSENQRPDFLPVDQKYIALEFNNGGRDLEKYEFRNANEALAAWKQVAHTLATAEVALEFEHRDLHWGNILIRESSKKNRRFRIGGDTYTVDTCSVETTIIDFSLSRMTSQDDQCTIYNNLAEDPTLFTARGAGVKGGDYQFDVYRLMKKENKNSWEEFNPKTNIFWLHYVLEKMVTEVYYKAKKNSKLHKSGLAKMNRLKNNLLEFNSAQEWVKKEGLLVFD